ncbi:MAG: ABC transporter permease [Betaproteobacteria bacterium RIFCSPLOWO2_02_FULL_65_24]|nr:MAG: ABC transporter permease [Betaproteobacteria bacterium RIFCSPLOWO2_02_FULL_65_24]OGA30859.1 MAG: ABC transporter permease [Betaproteobacteria bacterium RIFCSPLOWO2_12_FULL_62_13b]
MQGFASSLVSVAFHGLAYGMILYVISVGLSVTMGLMGFVNLAHGVFAMAGGYVMLTAMNSYDVGFPLALGIAFVSIAVASVVLERFLYARLYTAGDLEQVLFTIGLIFMAVAVARLIYGPLQQPVNLPGYLKGQYSLLGRDFPAYRAFLILFSSLLVGGLWFGVERTRWGAKVRAAVDNRPMAQAIGINTSFLFTVTFALGSGLAALGGALGADIIAIQPVYPFEHLVYFLIVVAVGGLGSLRGPFVAALLIGVTDTACKYWLPEFGAFFIYAATIGLLLWRPAGLFGKA